MKALVLLVVLLWMSVCVSAGESVSSTGASDDDCTMYYGAYSLTDDHSFFGSWNQIEQACGLRFRNVNIPQGATIDSAWVVLRSVADPYDVSARIYGNDVDSAVSFSDSLDFENCVRTSTYVDWNLTGDFGGEFLRSDTLTGGADLSPIIQEITNRPGWGSGNAIVLLFRNNGTTFNARKAFRSYDRGSYYADTLHVLYSEGGPQAQSLVRRRLLVLQEISE